MLFFSLFTFFCGIGLCLFIIGLLGCFKTRYNIIIILISLEFMLLSLNFFFILSSFYLDDVVGFFFFFSLFSLAGAEAALGLSFVILFYRLRGFINLRYLNTLKG
jgi:NADH:ubiquinone oxidoreductase subunit K